MVYITPPPPYSSVKQSVLFTIDHNLEYAFEVVINGYRKIMPKNAYSVNVANYFKESFRFPLLAPSKGLILETSDGFTTGRVVNASITVDGVPSDKVPLLCADRAPVANRFMSDMRRRRIRRGQVDELPVYVTGAATVRYGSVQAEVPEGVSIVMFRIPLDCADRFDVVLRSGGDELDRIEYVIDDTCPVRLRWVNAYGALDSWNFTACLKASTKVTKEKIYTADGYVATSIQSETTKSVVSRPQPEAETEVLRQILLAERVWQITDHRIIPVDITTETITTHNVEKLTSVQVDFRERIG